MVDVVEAFRRAKYRCVGILQQLHATQTQEQLQEVKSAQQQLIQDISTPLDAHHDNEAALAMAARNDLELHQIDVTMTSL